MKLSPSIRRLHLAAAHDLVFIPSTQIINLHNTKTKLLLLLQKDEEDNYRLFFTTLDELLYMFINCIMF